MRKYLAYLLFLPACTAAQDIPVDSVRLLDEILIQAYRADRTLDEVAASVGYISTAQMERFSNTAILPAVNTIPGVRMEERSPGSYRFSIRGSLLRSPFGVRNVKVYLNGLPLTDGGGNTYLNLLDFNSIGSMQVIKGPGGSLYGAGTGGVLLLSTPEITESKFQLSGIAGSYGLGGWTTSFQLKAEKFMLRVQRAYMQGDGYRDQSSMKRAMISADLIGKLNDKNTLSATMFFTDMTYETPGALTQAQYDENPKQSRPPGGPNPGAAEQKAAVYNKTPYLGLTHEFEWAEYWLTRTGVFGSGSSFTNPTIRNYEVRDERNFGARTETEHKFGKGERKHKWVFGAEYQRFVSPIVVSDNNQGVKGSVQTDDDLTSTLLLLFSQAEFKFATDLYVTLGWSFNFIRYDFERKEPAPLTSQQRKFDPVISPRIAVLKKFSDQVSAYASISRGFSPPSLAEVRPSTNTFNNTLKAETGINYESGLRGEIAGRLNYDFALYSFALDETIVIQRDADGAEYFVNAGKTSQQGIEAALSFNLVKNSAAFLSEVKLWNSYSYNHYRFKDYVQDGVEYSGNKITGVPPTVNTAGLDIRLKPKVYLNATANYVDHIPLNDPNTAFANEYFLLGARLGFKPTFGRVTLDFYAGVDNALDRKYSLGNDLNALGGRYFNIAPGINYYGGVKIILK